MSSPWQRYILSPSSRTPSPESIHSYDGDVLCDGATATFEGRGCVTFDFGREVGGLVTFSYAIAGPSAEISIAFCESPSFVGRKSDDTGATPSQDWDQAVHAILDPASAVYHLPKPRFRGGFRFLTIEVLGSVQIHNVRCEIGFAPGVADLRRYSGYFWSDDDLLNRVWYAGAYTCQTNIVPNNTGRHLPHVRPGWRYDAMLGSGPPGAPVLVDGAKRDRAVWPGDLGVAIPSTLIAFGPQQGWPAVKNALITVFEHQHADGTFPFAGPSTMSFLNGTKSQPYHLWSLIALGIVWDWGGIARAFVTERFEAISHAIELTRHAIASNGLIYLEQCNDWARLESPGFKASANALAFAAINKWSAITKFLGDERPAWIASAEGIRKGFELLWDEKAGLFRESPDADFHPQDGNSFASAFGLASQYQKDRISKSLKARWNDIGPLCPELPDTISPFISGLEVYSHFVAGKSDTALELIRKTWGYMLDAPHMGGTTLLEGMTADGGLNYRGEAGYNNDPSYCSMAHSWSSAPTSALTYHLLGLQHSHARPDIDWAFLPAPDERVRSVQGGYETLAGGFHATWEISGGRFIAEVRVPADQGKGLLGVPLRWGRIDGLTVNGEEIINETQDSCQVVTVPHGGTYRLVADITLT